MTSSRSRIVLKEVLKELPPDFLGKEGKRCHPISSGFPTASDRCRKH